MPATAAFRRAIRRRVAAWAGRNRRFGGRRPALECLSHIAGKLRQQFAGEVNAAGTGEGFERPRHVEIALDFEDRGLGPARRYHARGERPRDAAPVDAASLDRAAQRRVVIGELCLAAKGRHGRPKLDPDPALIGAALALGRECRAGNFSSVEIFLITLCGPAEGRRASQFKSFVQFP